MNKNDKKPNGTHGNGAFGEATGCTSRGGKHDANLRKRGFLHFQIGLILAMAIAYLALEAVFEVTKKPEIAEIEPIEESLIEVWPYDKIIVESDQKPRNSITKKVVNPSKITIVEHDPQLVETLFHSEQAETNVMAVDSVIFIKPEEPDPVVPFFVMVDVPIFPGCEKVKKEDRKICFEKMVKKHISKTFKYPAPARELEIEGKVYTRFTIDKNGNIVDIQMKGPSPILENEAGRIIQKLPKMTPGKQRGNPVGVSFSIPINFQLQD